MSRSSRSFRLFCFLPLLISILIKLPKMNDISLLAALVQKVQAAKKGVSLPTSLEGAAIYDVIVQDVVDKVTQEALLDDDGKPILTAFSVLGVPFSSLKVDQIRMLCSKWSLKKYRGFAREKRCLVIAQNQQLMVVYAAQAVTVKDKKMELQASKFRLLNVVFSCSKDERQETEG
jgi:hypothetical protein